jgi:predicted nucleic acid-binding protein
LTLVLDATIVVAACLGRAGFHELPDEDLLAPPLLWPEARSVLHLAAWRGRIPQEYLAEALQRLERAPIRSRNPSRLGSEAWRLADELGWGRTYDAEYVALASLLRCRMVTLDERLRRGADRLGFVVSPTEL